MFCVLQQSSRAHACAFCRMAFAQMITGMMAIIMMVVMIMKFLLPR